MQLLPFNYKFYGNYTLYFFFFLSPTPQNGQIHSKNSKMSRLVHKTYKELSESKFSLALEILKCIFFSSLLFLCKNHLFYSSVKFFIRYGLLQLVTFIWDNNDINPDTLTGISVHCIKSRVICRENNCYRF